MPDIMMEISDKCDSEVASFTLNLLARNRPHLNESQRKFFAEKLVIQAKIEVLKNPIKEFFKFGQERHPERPIAKPSSRRSWIPRPVTKSQAFEEKPEAAAAKKRQYGPLSHPEEDSAKKRRTTLPSTEPVATSPREVKNVFERLYALRKVAPCSRKSEVLACARPTTAGTPISLDLCKKRLACPKVSTLSEPMFSTNVQDVSNKDGGCPRPTSSSPDVFERLYSSRKVVPAVGKPAQVGKNVPFSRESFARAPTPISVAKNSIEASIVSDISVDCSKFSNVAAKPSNVQSESVFDRLYSSKKHARCSIGRDGYCRRAVSFKHLHYSRSRNDMATSDVLEEAFTGLKLSECRLCGE